MTAESAFEPTHVGGRYRIERLLGRGGMGDVHAALDEGTGRRVALKRLHEGASDRLLALFEREYRTLASLSHDRIVRVYEYGVHEGSVFYTMELLEGSDLSERAPMDFRDACACLRDVASILGVLHARHLVHRDLSPGNLWRTPDGHIKLLDFGALAPFGVASEVVGTPPFVAPEALAGEELDGRTDLFALGALGYWLLTGTHAFRVAGLGALPRAWETEPATPSSLVKHLTGNREVPRALDHLILALLRRNKEERPRATMGLVDTLSAVTELGAEPQDTVIQGYLANPAFTGRTREQRRFDHQLRTVQAGEPRTVVVEGPEGIGRSRLIAELSMTARVKGATVVAVADVTADRPYGTAVSLAEGLLTALPHAALEAAGPHMAVLGSLSAELHARLGKPQAPPSSADVVRERADRQLALSSWIESLAEDRTLVVVLDDLHAADEESQALMVHLAHIAAPHRLLLLCGVRTDHARSEDSAVCAVRAAAKSLPLSMQSAPEMREMLRSVFGEATYLERLSAHFHAITKGCPGHAMMLARHLVQAGIARYAEGCWQLPMELPDALPVSMRAGVLMALEKVPDDFRRFARLASLPDHGPLDPLTLGELAGLDPGRTREAVELLCSQEVLSASREGVRVEHAALREKLSAELDASTRQEAHRRLAETLAQDGDLLAQMRATLHWLRASEWERGEAGVLYVSRRLWNGENEKLAAVVKMYADALSLLKAGDRSEHAQVPALCMLAMAGYVVHYTYAQRHGDEAMAVMQRLLRFDLVRRFSRYLGGKLSFLIAMIVATLALKRAGSSLRAKEVVEWLVSSVASLTGAAAVCIDPEASRRHTQAMEPLLALGSDHAATYVHRLCLSLATGVEERPGESQRLIVSLIDRLNRPEPVPSMPEHNRMLTLAGAYYGYGVRQGLACDPALLETAEKLASFGPLQQMQAEQLRAVYHAMRGDLKRAAEHQRSYELRAIELGAAWQAELWVPSQMARVAALTWDAVAMKQALKRLDRLARDVPSLEAPARAARATYLALQGKLDEALPLLRLHEEPLARIGWVQNQGVLAGIHNSRGEHDQAHAICTNVLTRLQPEDLEFVMLNFTVRVELTVAEAGLGHRAEAESMLREMEESYAQKGALVMARVRWAAVRVAMLAGHDDACDAALDALEELCAGTGIQSLMAHVIELRDEWQQTDPAAEGLDGRLAVGDAHLFTRVQLIMTNSSDLVDERAVTALRVALDLTHADGGFVVFRDRTRAPVHEGRVPLAEALAWARARFAELEQDEEDTVYISSDQVDPSADVREFDGEHYCLAPLWPAGATVTGPVAILVLRAVDGLPLLPPAHVLDVMATHLGAATASETGDVKGERVS